MLPVVASLFLGSISYIGGKWDNGRNVLFTITIYGQIKQWHRLASSPVDSG